MTIVHRLAALTVCLLVLAPQLAVALELGPIEARSALYEPLDARIPIRGARGGDLQGMNVMLGSPAQFELAGVARLPHLNLLEFAVVEDGSAGGYVQVRTEEPIIEPSLTFLIDVDWPRGRTVRGYRLRLAQGASGAVAARQDRPEASETRPASDTGTSDTGTSDTGTSDTRGSGAGATDATSVSSPGSDATEYGPVREAETLWSIAARLRPDSSVSVQRMMLAILETNPESFEFSNVNALNAGTTLRIPSRVEIGADDRSAAIAEVQRQHSAWVEYRQGTRRAATPSAATPDDSTTGPTGRVEVVSPDASRADREEGTGAEALRKELALAMEEVDAGRRENDELKLRLAESEDHIRELNRLVDLKNQEIAALQAELLAQAETAPKPDAPPAEPEPAPVPVPDEAGPKPVLAPAEDASQPEAAPTQAQPVPVESDAPAAAEPKSLPFGLGALPVNPVFLVGGAGLLLILLGVVALLRRRRVSAGEDDTLEVAEPSSPDDDNLLLELEAVAAELGDEPDRPQGRPSRTVPAAGAVGIVQSDAAVRAFAEPDADSMVEEQVAALWKDDRAARRATLAETEADDDASETTFDIDALIRDDADSSVGDDEASDDFDIADLADLADLAAEREADPSRSTDESIGNLDLLFGRHEADAALSESPASTPTSESGESLRPGSRIPDEEPDDALREILGDRTSVASESAIADAAVEDADPRPVPAAVERAATEGGDIDATDGESIHVEPVADGEPSDSRSTPTKLLDQPSEGSESGSFSLEDFGEDEVQTKIDLAQVYMEMGDSESARGFLEAVLAEGSAEQQVVARDMLSKLA